MAEQPPRRRGTSTSAFGVSRRENHDASAFYERFVAPDVSRDSEVSPRKAIDEVFCHDARSMPELDDASVALVVTSPPYFAGKEYETALGEGHVPATYAEYLSMLEDVFAECVRKLEPGGRIAVNVANLGRKPYRSLSADVTWILQDRLRLLLRGEIVWVKARGAAGSCAWGSFQRPANPVLRDLTERVVVAAKGRFDRALSASQRAARGLPCEGSSSRDEFMEATTDVWELPTERAGLVGHPAPFPVELPERLIHLYTYRGDLVLDPFMGSGSTAVAAVRTGRHFAGYDTDEDYVLTAKRRVAAERDRLETEAGAGVGVGVVVPAPASSGGGGHWAEEAVRAGMAAKELARRTLDECGFVDARAGVSLPCGVDVSFRARDGRGREWLVEVAGSFTAVRPGLRRADVLWRTLGKAAVLHAACPDLPLLVLTPALPTGALVAPLAAAVGPDRPIAEVVVLGSAAEVDRLSALAISGFPTRSGERSGRGRSG